jgi:hypothetical protein
MVSIARKPPPKQFPFGRSSVSSSPRFFARADSRVVKAGFMTVACVLCFACFVVYKAGSIQEAHVAAAAAALFHNPLNRPPSMDYAPFAYQPAPSEKFVIEHADELGYNSQEWTKGCNIWGNETPSEISVGLHAMIPELTDYNNRVQTFQPVKDLRKQLIEGDDVHNAAVCQTVELDPAGLPGIFKSGELSQTANAGYVEPLLPPMRHPEYCFYGDRKLLDLGYLVHDFSAMCRKLKPTSRTILIDMGASLRFHQEMHHLKDMPAVYLGELYKQFGFPFDHIYAFEKQPQDAQKVYEEYLPEAWLTSYHWINAGVSADPTSRLNPLRWILDTMEEDDLVVVKIDIDTPSIELPLVLQLLKDPRYDKLVDQFYFEHHVKLYELGAYWTANHAVGSIRDSLHLFAGLRAKGIASHFLV